MKETKSDKEEPQNSQQSQHHIRGFLYTMIVSPKGTPSDDESVKQNEWNRFILLGFYLSPNTWLKKVTQTILKLNASDR